MSIKKDAKEGRALLDKRKGQELKLLKPHEEDLLISIKPKSNPPFTFG